jgi:membrane protein DedA with SNARE-associated domain
MQAMQHDPATHTKGHEELTDQEKAQAQQIALVFVVILVGILFYLRLKGIIPGQERVVDFLEVLYTRYGYSVVFFSAILEGIILLNFYIPGSTAIILGVVFAHRNGLSAPLMVGLAIAGFLLAYTLNYWFNYWLGRYELTKLLHKFGYDKQIDNIKDRLSAKGHKLILTSFFHPNLAALISTGAGIIKMPFSTFITVTAISVIFLGFAMGLFGFYLWRESLARVLLSSLKAHLLFRSYSCGG